MPAYSSSRRGLSPLAVFSLVLLLLVVAGGGTVGGLWSAGIIDLPFMKKAEPTWEGYVKIPMSGRMVPAYARVLRDDLADPKTGLWNELWIPQSVVTPNMLIDRTKILGRVLNHDKAAGYAFTEEDFLPAGTRPGLVAGIPPGKRSLTLEAAKLIGIHGLQMGDQFDVVATLPVDKTRQPAPHSQAAAALPPPQPQVRVIVHSGVVVAPVRMRATISTSQSLVGGPRTTAKPVEEVVIAVEPEEVSELTAAISQEAAITCVARSGHPEDAKVSRETPGSTPPPPPTAIETVWGSKRETLYFPKPIDEVSKRDGSHETPRTQPFRKKTVPQETRQQQRNETLPQASGASAVSLRTISARAVDHDVP
jgi:Flp pilus assembly protein CpaB